MGERDDGLHHISMYRISLSGHEADDLNSRLTLPHLENTSTFFFSGKSNRLPMIGNPLGPGGRGKLLERLENILLRMYVEVKTPASRNTTEDGETRDRYETGNVGAERIVCVMLSMVVASNIALLEFMRRIPWVFIRFVPSFLVYSRLFLCNVTVLQRRECCTSI